MPPIDMFRYQQAHPNGEFVKRDNDVQQDSSHVSKHNVGKADVFKDAVASIL